MIEVAYEFVEAFSSVVPQVRLSKITAVVGIILDVLWRIFTRNFYYPSFVDVIPAVLIGYCLGKRPKNPAPGKDEKSKWTRLS